MSKTLNTIVVIGMLAVLGLQAVATIQVSQALSGSVDGNNQPAVGGTRYISGLSTGTTMPNPGDLIVEDDVDLEAASFCIDFHATSTDTVLSMTASSTATVSGQTTEGGVILFNYGSCQ